MCKNDTNVGAVNYLSAWKPLYTCKDLLYPKLPPLLTQCEYEDNEIESKLSESIHIPSLLPRPEDNYSTPIPTLFHRRYHHEVPPQPVE